jgi:hypothetical protein
MFAKGLGIEKDATAGRKHYTPFTEVLVLQRHTLDTFFAIVPGGRCLQGGEE